MKKRQRIVRRQIFSGADVDFYRLVLACGHIRESFRFLEVGDIIECQVCTLQAFNDRQRQMEFPLGSSNKPALTLALVGPREG